MSKDYWQTRVLWYKEQASHIKEQKKHAEQPEERIKLLKELERVYNEISFIRDHCLK